MALMPTLSGQAIAIGWLLLPFLGSFLSALLPVLARWLALLCCAATAFMAAAITLGALQLGAFSSGGSTAGVWPGAIELLGPYGVSLQVDDVAMPFLLLNGLVGGAVLLDGWRRLPPGPFLPLLMVLHGGLNSAFVATDLISLYVTLEVVGVSAFLLILINRSERSLWVALRYLLIGNTVMTLYLIGAAVVYVQTGSFQLGAVAATTGGAALALLLVGLLTKSGLFLSGLWLPLTHAESPAVVSALLSGVVVTSGIAPLLRLSVAIPALHGVIPAIGLASAALGLLFALVDQEVKRMLAWSTLSQMGLVVLAPAVGGIYALGHGVAKAVLFLSARRFPARDLAGWKSRPLPPGVWAPLWIASLSVVGLPPLLGFTAKYQLDKAISTPMGLVVSVLTVGTVAVYCRLLGAPLSRPKLGTPPPQEGEPEWSAGVVLLLGALLVLGVALLGLEVGNGLQGESASRALALATSSGKTALVLLAGLGLHRLLEPWRRWGNLALPKLEGFTDLIGGIGLVGAGLLVMLSQ